MAFHHTKRSNSDLERHISHFVYDDRSQEQGVDFDETFSLVVRPTTICIVLGLAMARQWSIHQYDVKNTFFTW